MIMFIDDKVLVVDGTNVTWCLLLSFLISLLFITSDQNGNWTKRKPETRVSDDNNNGKWLHPILNILFHLILTQLNSI